MKCPYCECEMEEYVMHNGKITYNNYQDTNIRYEEEIHICPNCKTIVGKAE